MATTSPFDPDKLDPEYYSKDPNQHGDSDYGRESEGVGTNQIGTTSGMDMDTENRNMTHDTREANTGEGRVGDPRGESLGTSQEWDVDADAISEAPKGHMMSDEAAKKLSEVAENPSDDALFHRSDATYLEEGDDPNKGYDPHNVGYTGKDKESVQKDDVK
ncbi:hypothetical protein [Spirosoma fluviale]|uniref:Uncharacterized protein n=1 Tax=Spirosoma fluviale TaxID=1597977 RepID=A0A286G328_9BACT|nr:hypothetical protein [Spirosoma fluviale]SOD89893.1 hypothetical protein SAMN06269250_3226 [Spirosoma fluviale]